MSWYNIHITTNDLLNERLLNWLLSVAESYLHTITAVMCKVVVSCTRLIRSFYCVVG